VQNEGWSANSRAREERESKKRRAELLWSGGRIGRHTRQGKTPNVKMKHFVLFSCCHSPFPKGNRDWKVDGECC
jgi:hypothetical protein